MAQADYCASCSLQSPPGSTGCVMCGRPLAAAPSSGTRRLPRPPSPQTGRVEPGGLRPLNVGAPSTSRLQALGRVAAAPLGDEPETRRLKSPFKPLSPAEARAVQPPVDPSALEPEGEVVAWLSCEPFRSVPLGPKPMVGIGRSRGNAMILPHESVSREHAVVRCIGGGLVLDDRSTYGTFVNGERVSSSPVKPGDVIAIGPYAISIRTTREQRAAPAKQGEEETKPFKVMSQSTEAMAGRLERVSLAEVLQQIEFNEKTGTLRIFNAEVAGNVVEGVLVAYEGKPMFAELGEQRDVEAVMTMLRLARGNFSFMAKVEAGEMTMAGMTMTGLLMESSRQIDEESG